VPSDHLISRTGACGFLVLFDQRSDAPDWPLRMSVSLARTASSLAVTVLRG